jgi:hypothetical protein
VPFAAVVVELPSGLRDRRPACSKFGFEAETVTCFSSSDRKVGVSMLEW